MLLSPRPTTLLPSSAMGEYTAINKVDRPPYLPRTETNTVQSPRQKAVDMTLNRPTVTKSVVVKESPRRPSSKRSVSGQKSTPELSRADSSASVGSRGSNTSIHRSSSNHSVSSMKRSMSKELGTPTKRAPKQFVVRSKASRVIHPSSSTQLARTPSAGRLTQHADVFPLTRTDSPNRGSRKTSDSIQASDRNSLSTTQIARQQILNSAKPGAVASPPPIRRTLSDGNGTGSFVLLLNLAGRFRRSSSETSAPSPLTRPRRSSNLARDARDTVQMMQQTEFSDDSDSDSDASDEQIEIPVRRRPLLEEPELSIPIRKITERIPPVPPTLQLRRPSQSGNQSTSPRNGISALTMMANNSSTFNHLMQPGPAPVAPPSVTTTSAVVKDLPYVPLTVGSQSSVKERISMLQNGRIPDDMPSQPETTSNSGEITNSPSDERTTATTSGSKPVSLENTRYALSPEAHNMIRKLSNGPPGMIRRPSSPSPPAMPSGWVRPERPTRTMSRQVMYRDLEQQALEQQHPLFSPIPRTDSRSDYFNPPMSTLAPGNFEEDPFLNTLPQLNRELRRIEHELNNVKKFNDPMVDALKRLHERSGPNSPVLGPSIPSQSSGAMFSLSSSLMKRFSPERRDLSPEALRKNSLPSRLRESSSRDEVEPPEDHRDGGVKVFEGENESKLREVTRQLWFSWPENPNPNQDSGDVETEEKSGSTEKESSGFGTSASPSDVRSNRPHQSVERRSFGSGLRQTWGSALALAGLRHS